MIEIKIPSSTVMEAIEAYVKEQYGFNVNLDFWSADWLISEGVVMNDF